jgi:hypothetical protein
LNDGDVVRVDAKAAPAPVVAAASVAKEGDKV